MFEVFEWIQNLPPNAMIQRSAWMQAAINIMHVLSLMVFAGAVLIVDLRLLGVGVKDQPLRQVAEDARPWLVGGLWALFLTGLPQFGALAVRNYYNWFFWFKMSILVIAVLFTLTIRRSVTIGSSNPGPFTLKAVALVSMALWVTVAISGRLIGLT
jgi:uncharacterized membrane protein